MPLLFALFCFAHADSFTDKDLHQYQRETLKSQKPIILVTWSPHMPLSERAVEDLFQLQRTTQIQPLVLLDPSCRFSLAQKVATQHLWPAEVLKLNQSQELMSQGIRVHYPSYLLLAKGKTASPVIPGYKLPQELKMLQRRYLK
jgi:hypothetical protein